MPITNYQTPSPLVRRRLLSYDREQHLLPLIYTYSKQDIQYGRGELVGYDFARIQADLAFALTPTLNPVAIAIEEFIFRVSYAVIHVLHWRCEY